MTAEWFVDYFGEDYYHFDRHEDTALEVEGLSQLIGKPDGRLILDLGCGYGRHTAPLRSRGYRVVGYDRSPALLRHAQIRDPSGFWIRGDMRALPFLEPFDIVISLFNSLGYFEEENDNFRALRSVGEVLRPDGLFICQLVNRDYLIRNFPSQAIHRQDDCLVLEERDFDAVSNRVHATTTVFRNDDASHNETKGCYRSTIRVYTVTELDLLLTASGLVILEVFGGFDFRPYNWDTNQLVIVAKRADF